MRKRGGYIHQQHQHKVVLEKPLSLLLDIFHNTAPRNQAEAAKTTGCETTKGKTDLVHSIENTLHLPSNSNLEPEVILI